MAYDLVCFGELLWDVFDEEKKIGGAPFNVAAIAGLLGVDSAMITAVGNDALGEELVAAAEGKTRLVLQKNDRPTGSVIVTLDKNKKPSFEIAEDVAYDYIELNEEITAAVKDAKFFCYGTLAQRNEVSRNTLKKILEGFKGVKIYDFNYRTAVYNWEPLFRESVKFADVLKLNEDEVALVKQAYGHTGSDRACAFELLAEHSLKYIFVTMGERGAMLYAKDLVLELPSPKADVVDTTGCGDAFTAAIAYSFLNGFDEKKMLEYCVAVAAKVAAVKGAVPDQLSQPV